ncbi:hypothetical protein F4802DRAFT_591719 [Xylaria palmicola]|nr:hypothetical protein F4802DRAFT_591719 [Xylaria palmicola]
MLFSPTLCSPHTACIMAIEDIPRLSAMLRLEPATYSLSSEPSTLYLGITSYHNDPITILTENLSPQWMLRNGTALIITDLDNDCVVEQVKRRPCRIPPPTSVSVPLIESHLYTLYPEQPLVLSAPFSVRFKQQNQSPSTSTDPAQEWGSQTDRRSSSTQPFVPGHSYKVSLSGDRHLQWYSIRWWEYGTKEEVLARGLDRRVVRFGNGPHKPISVDISGINPIIFRCTE